MSQSRALALSTSHRHWLFKYDEMSWSRVCSMDSVSIVIDKFCFLSAIFAYPAQAGLREIDDALEDSQEQPPRLNLGFFG